MGTLGPVRARATPAQYGSRMGPVRACPFIIVRVTMTLWRVRQTRSNIGPYWLVCTCICLVKAFFYVQTKGLTARVSSQPGAIIPKSEHNFDIVQNMDYYLQVAKYKFKV